MGDKKPIKWRGIANSVRGSAHLRKGLENQDAFCFYPSEKKGTRMILSVADGHGSQLCFRSNIGSGHAARVVKEELRKVRVKIFQFIKDKSPEGEVKEEEVKRWGSFIKAEAENSLPRNIQKIWRRKIDEDYKEKPFTDEEINLLKGHVSDEKVKKLQENHYLAYGTTVLSVLVTEYFIIYVQLGDGDILTIDEDGKITAPMPKDPRLIANETTSLSQKDAYRDIQIKVQLLQEPQSAPALIMLSTDGLKNSFKSEADYTSFGTDIFKKIKSDGIKPGIRAINASLKRRLEKISREGSGDDVTVGFLCRSDA